MKKMKKAMAGVKVKAPFVWDGKPNMDTFDHWTYEVDTWIKLCGLTDKLAMLCIGNFMSGTASKFFMNFVVNEPKKWTVKKVYTGLFDFCFPVDFKLSLRKRLLNAYQGKKTVRKFDRDIRMLAKRFPDVTERQLVQIFWDGAEQYIRAKWLDRGMSPEDTTLDKLSKWATRFEKSKEAMDREDRDWKPKPNNRTWGRFKNRTRGNEPWIPPKDHEDSPYNEDTRPKDTKAGKGTGKAGPSSQNKTPVNDKFKPKSKNKDKPRLSEDELDRLRAEDRCLTCKETGHQSRNCPTKHEAKAPKTKVSVGAARYEYLNSLDMEELTKAREKAADSASVRVPTPGTPEFEITEEDQLDKDEIWLRAPASEICAYIKNLWMSTYPPEEAVAENLAPTERFTVIEYGIGFEVTDWLKSQVPYMVTREDIANRNFRVQDVVNDAWDKHLSAPRDIDLLAHLLSWMI
ncbi:hypothetical protein DFH07DRAFT_1016808 [Mycena maculata]|uniref:CCHC-type domain-containing protein n=1 Tax=Mycena maculata TaxID=230809 RepID=A0AAD7JJL7_9AGAR|nr:hypothetical protein DFH07DRAFT_1016808 [Mycena maculata]